MLQWVIVGGGLHGTHLSHMLTTVGKVDRDDVRVIDPEDQPLASWFLRSRICGARFLRSPAVHNLGVSAYALLRFSDDPRDFAGHYRRPSLALFNRHCRALIQRYALQRLRLRGRVVEIMAISGGYRIIGPGVEVTSRRVVLSPGQPPPHYPDWALDAPGIQHVFDATTLPRHGSIAIVGGGLSAAEVALTLARAGRHVTLLSRHPPRIAAFDSDPCYLGPKCLRAFHAQGDPVLRRAMIRRARYRGSVPEWMHAKLETAVAQRALTWLEGEVAAREPHGVQLVDGRRVAADTVLLATGYASCPPAEALVECTARRLRLPRTPDGYPVLDRDLQWGKGLFASGRLAELGLGPAAGNIAGARMAGRQLVNCQRST